jgi:hypothetical protein
MLSSDPNHQCYYGTGKRCPAEKPFCDTTSGHCNDEMWRNGADCVAPTASKCLDHSC